MIPIKDYEGLYSVTKEGCVYSHITGKFLKPNKMKTGYLSVELWKNRTNKRVLIHRLVAQAFIPNPNNYPQVNHKDEDKQNNSVENLEWCTSKYNLNYGNTQLRKSTNRKITDKVRSAGRRNALLKSKPVLQFSKTGEFIAHYESAMHAERVLGVRHTHVSEVCLGKRKTANGYKWKYERSN